MEQKSPVDHVDKQVQVGGVGEVTRHALYHAVYQLHPRVLVQLVYAAEFLGRDNVT